MGGDDHPDCEATRARPAGQVTFSLIAEHRRPSPSLGQDEAVRFKLLVGSTHGVEVDPQHLGKAADRRQTLPLDHFAARDQPFQL